MYIIELDCISKLHKCLLLLLTVRQKTDLIFPYPKFYLVPRTAPRSPMMTLILIWTYSLVHVLPNAPIVREK